MKRPLKLGILGVVALLLFALASPWLVGAYWRMRSANPVRRGVELARDLGCFSCHGELGGSGIQDPGATGETVPGWSGGVWMMYVTNDDDIRNFIRFGARSGATAAAGQDDGHDHDHDEAGIDMPAYDRYVNERKLNDLVAAFKVLARMSLPPTGTPARSGYELARTWDCFSCHAQAGSGGLPNPGSFSGFIPGWYGADFDELVRSREEFDGWILKGGVPRIVDHPVAGWFQRRQRIAMPAYRQFSAEELDQLWEYALWLSETDGGHAGVSSPW